MNETEPNKQTESKPLTPIQKQILQAKYKRLISLIPHGKHKNQGGTKGAFGKSNRERPVRK